MAHRQSFDIDMAEPVPSPTLAPPPSPDIMADNPKLDPPPTPPSPPVVVAAAATALALCTPVRPIQTYSEDLWHPILRFLNPFDVLRLHEAVGDTLTPCVHYYYGNLFRFPQAEPAEPNAATMPAITARLYCKHTDDLCTYRYYPDLPPLSYTADCDEPIQPEKTVEFVLRETVFDVPMRMWQAPTIHTLVLTKTGDPQQPVRIPQHSLIRSVSVKARQTVDAARLLQPFTNLHCLRLEDLVEVTNVYAGFPKHLRRLQLNRIEEIPVGELQAYVRERNGLGDGGLEWFECRGVNAWRTGPWRQQPQFWCPLFEALRVSAKTLWLDARLLRFLPSALTEGLPPSQCEELFVEFDETMDFLKFLEHVTYAKLDNLQRLHLVGEESCSTLISDCGAKRRYGKLLGQLKVLTLRNLIMVGGEFAHAVSSYPELRLEVNYVFQRLPNDVDEPFIPGRMAAPWQRQQRGMSRTPQERLAANRRLRHREYYGLD